MFAKDPLSVAAVFLFVSDFYCALLFTDDDAMKIKGPSICGGAHFFPTSPSGISQLGFWLLVGWSVKRHLKLNEPINHSQGLPFFVVVHWQQELFTSKCRCRHEVGVSQTPVWSMQTVWCNSTQPEGISRPCEPTQPTKSFKHIKAERLTNIRLGVRNYPGVGLRHRRDCAFRVCLGT